MDIEEVGEVARMRLLHLQCHYGLDTLSWGLLGASATGVDFSKPAIDRARRLASELHIPAEFVCSDVYDLEAQLAGDFDIVYTGGGVLCWLPDLTEWGRIIAHFLTPGGRFHLVEFHPVAGVFKEDRAELIPAYPYFRREAFVDDSGDDYLDRRARLEHATTYEWNHSMADIINSLIQAGLVLDWLHEFPTTGWQRFAGMMASPPDGWRLAGDPIPLSFSIRATKPA
ncbi:MAG TPA: class I SAM-dependent methyltransferase [Chloroflexota bacterium]|nr:class I SAM-dependent methyltransferase [Chloroflexota bacterium]